MAIWTFNRGEWTEAYVFLRLLGESRIYGISAELFKNETIDNLIIIDNSVLSFAYHLDNGVPILPYYKGNEDNELKILTAFK